MKQLLLDTHALVWWLYDHPKLSIRAHDLIAAAEDVYVSAASIYEIDSKRRIPDRRRTLGGLSLMPPNMPEVLPLLGLRLLDISCDVAWRAANLSIDHGDPWDRILIAQAALLDIPLVSADRVLIAQAGDTPVIW